MTTLAPLPARCGRGAGSPSPSPSSRTARTPRIRLHRRTRGAGVAATAALLAAGLLAPAAVQHLAVPLAVAGVLVGIPHGAVDHLVPGWVAGRALGRRAMTALLVAYVAVAAVGTLSLTWAPTATLLVFLAVSAWHFGRAEVVVAAEAADRRPPAAHEELLPALAHGLVTVVLPLAAWPAVSLPLLGMLAPGLAGLDHGMLRGVTWLVLGATAVAVADLLLRRRREDAAQLVLLAAVFTLVHPVAAFGLYFGAWHAARHTARLVEVAAGAWPLRAGLGRYLTQAAAPTVLALAFLVAVRVTARADGAGPSPLLAAELATLLALTFPHAAVVALMDHAQRARPPAGGATDRADRRPRR